MPELPLVERYRAEAASFLVGRVVTKASSVVDTMMMPELTPHQFRRAMVGRKIIGVERRGKYIWLQFTQPPHLVLHFGMTGELRYDPPARPSYACSARLRLGLPRHWRLALTLDSGQQVVLVDPRRFGRVLLVHDPIHEPPISELGFDPWLDRISTKQFTAVVRARSAPIKAILLDQSFAAGVGNWIADDVLYLARVAPQRRGHTLSLEECQRIRRHLVAVVRKATQVGSYEDKFPRAWLFHLRWGRHRDIKTRSGECVRFDTVATRSTAWVPTRQR